MLNIQQQQPRAGLQSFAGTAAWLPSPSNVTKGQLPYMYLRNLTLTRVALH